MKRQTKIYLIVLLFIAGSHTAIAQGGARVNYVVSDEAAAKIVSSVLRVSPVIDGHNDLFIHYFDCKECPRDLMAYRIDVAAKGHTDIPRWRKGGVGGQLLNIFGSEQTSESQLSAYDLLHRMEAAYPNDLRVVGTSREMRAASRNGKIAILPTLESAVRLKNNMALLRSYYDLGLRSVTFAYRTNDLADGSEDTPKHNGVSSFGKEMIKEMNRLGIMIDASHVSADAMNGILDSSQAPIIFSHSNARALCDVNRNVPDQVLRKLKTNRGIVMLTFVPYFVSHDMSKWMDDSEAYFELLSKKYSGDMSKATAEMDAWETTNPQPIVTISAMADQFDYVKNLIGVEYLGIAGDYDGIPFTIKGLEDVSTYPNLLIELAKRGWTEKDLRKITGENFLRVFEEVEAKAAALKKTMQPSMVKFVDKK
ncbi:MAG TPA: dipeptidase [Pyrinomonadaceae bacterium]|nr:dipeptidase [Acidobacteriota bacterium]HQZ95785.1 dipeptidase [Pyrinomonadaceae bacterium]